MSTHRVSLSTFVPDSRLVRAGIGALVVLLGLSFIVALPGVLSPELTLSLRKTFGFLIILISTGLCVARPIALGRERLAWACIAAFLLCNTFGAAYFATQLADTPARPAPSVSDLFWFLRYPFLYVGLRLLVRSRTQGFSAAQWVDGAVGAGTLVAVAGVFVMEPVLNHMADPVARAIFVAYPVANMIGLGFLVGVIALKGLRVSNWVALGLALILFVVGDGLYVRALAITGFAPVGGPQDVGYLVGALFFAVAAWQPATREHQELSVRGSTAVLPLIFAAIGLTVINVEELRSLNAFVAVGAGLALCGVLVRQAMFAVENRRILARVSEEAVTDALTGLPNRRSVIDDLERRLEDVDRDGGFALALMDLDGFKGYNDAFGHHAGDELLIRLARKLDHSVFGYGRAYRLGGDEFCVLTAAGQDHRGIADRAAAALFEEGKGFRISCSYGVVAVPEETTDATEVLRLADGRMYADKGEGRRTQQTEEVTAVLSAVQRERHPGLDGHTDGVASWAVRVAERLGVAPGMLKDIRLGATLHDVGKMAVPDGIVDKPGPLDAEEWEFMRRHTIVGARILEVAPGLQPAARVARWHHERWDGGGYPDGLSRDKIPLVARIVAVCDAFQAMIDDRPYRRGRPVAEAIAELRRCAGTQFDPMIVETFVSVISEAPVTDAHPVAVA